MIFSQKMPLYFYTYIPWGKKVKNDHKLKSRVGYRSCLKSTTNLGHPATKFEVVSVINSSANIYSQRIGKQSNRTPFFFYPTNVNWQLDQTKNTQRSPAGDRTRVFRLPVGRSTTDHWATKPRQELHANFCLSPNCQFCFATRWPECLSLQTRRDQRNSLDLNIIVQIEIRSCRDHSI